MKLSSVLDALNFLWRAEKIWSMPAQTDVLIYDRVGADVFFEYVDIDKTQVFETRGESINIVILMVAILKFGVRVNAERYQSEYLNWVRPRVVLTFIDNTITFYRLKKYFQETRFISVQNGYRDNVLFDIISSELKDNEVLQADAVFCFGSAIGKKYASVISSKIYPLGSFKNNKVPLKKDLKNRSEILYISQYRPPVWENSIPGMPVGGRNIYWEDFYSTEALLLPNLFDLARKNGFQFKILGTSFNNEGEEVRYYSSLIGEDGWEYSEKNNSLHSYEKVDSSGIIAFIDSTLGYECLGRGARAMAFPARGNVLCSEDRGFGWPSDLAPQGEFWTNRVDHPEIERIFKYVTSIDDVEWGQLSNKHIPKIMGFDEGNASFSDLLKDFGVSKTQH